MSKPLKYLIAFGIAAFIVIWLAQYWEMVSDLFVDRSVSDAPWYSKVFAGSFLFVLLGAPIVIVVLIGLARITYMFRKDETDEDKVKNTLHDATNPFYIVNMSLPKILERIFMFAAGAFLLCIVIAQVYFHYFLK